jgi:hypothetical protein
VRRGVRTVIDPGPVGKAARLVLREKWHEISEYKTFDRAYIYSWMSTLVGGTLPGRPGAFGVASAAAVVAEAGRPQSLPRWRRPLVYLEALAAGLPVLAFAGSSVADSVYEHDTGAIVRWGEPLNPAAGASSRGTSTATASGVTIKVARR